MKNIEKVGVLFMVIFTSCVPYRDYKNAKSQLTTLNSKAADLRVEIKALEKENRILVDTINKRTVHSRLMARAMKSRLEAIRIRMAAMPSELAELSLRGPELDEKTYGSFMQNYTSRDTASANGIAWLNTTEKNIYYYLNWARLNPKDFCNRFVIPMLNRDSTDIYVITLIDYMYRMKPMNALIPNKEQYDNAKCHATVSGTKGYIGHERQSATCKKSFWGECCSYGLGDPLAVVLQLLVDRNVSSLGHRYICLGWYNSCGISIAPHKTFGKNVVLDFH